MSELAVAVRAPAHLVLDFLFPFLSPLFKDTDSSPHMVFFAICFA